MLEEPTAEKTRFGKRGRSIAASQVLLTFSSPRAFLKDACCYQHFRTYVCGRKGPSGFSFHVALGAKKQEKKIRVKNLKSGRDEFLPSQVGCPAKNWFERRRLLRWGFSKNPTTVQVFPQMIFCLSRKSEITRGK